MLYKEVLHSEIKHTVIYPGIYGLLLLDNTIGSKLLYPQMKVGDILDSGPSRRRRRRRRNFLVDAITQKQINFFFQTWYTC